MPSMIFTIFEKPQKKMKFNLMRTDYLPFCITSLSIVRFKPLKGDDILLKIAI